MHVSPITINLLLMKQPLHTEVKFLAKVTITERQNWNAVPGILTSESML